MNRQVKFFIFILLLASGCRDLFIPELSFQETHFLVVEGYINVGDNAVTTIRLSRTVHISEANAKPQPERGALVWIEDDENTKYALLEKENGTYISDKLVLPLDRNYRLRISSNEKEFVSEFTTPVVTPAIDTLYWKYSSNGVDIYVETHDPENKTRYYQWDYEETWELSSPYFSFYRLRNGEFFPREDSEINAMKKCWKTSVPNDLLIESTANLSIDKVSRRLINIPVNNEKLTDNYSVMVRQHALSLKAYSYLTIMRKNTNELGTFFDPQPSQPMGNIKVLNSAEPVIGFINAYTTSETRLNIRENTIANGDFNLFCTEIPVSLSDPVAIGLNFGNLGLIPTTILNEERTTIGAAPLHCVDCRVRGGNNNKPPFWDDIF